MWSGALCGSIAGGAGGQTRCLRAASIGADYCYGRPHEICQAGFQPINTLLRGVKGLFCVAQFRELGVKCCGHCQLALCLAELSIEYMEFCCFLGQVDSERSSRDPSRIPARMPIRSETGTIVTMTQNIRIPVRVSRTPMILETSSLKTLEKPQSP